MMTIEEKIQNLFGLETKEYFKNKQKGGKSNQKGSRYEEFFSVMQLAKSFALLMKDDSQSIEIIAQAEAFVDDLVVVDMNCNSKQHFQLKTTEKLSWGRKEKSIRDDFYKQKILNDDSNISSTYIYLVNSSSDRVKILKDTIPSDISSFTDVIYFPEAATINELSLICKDFKKSISQICLSNDPDKIEALSKIILAHWVDKKTTITSVKDFLLTLENIFPNYLAKISVAIDFLPGVENILSNIVLFDYKIEKGYFSWNYGNLDSGIFSYPVDSKEFMLFQQEVLSECPKIFDDLESKLL